MKTPEILFASAVIAVVAGVGTALATRAFQATPARAEAMPRGASSESVPADGTEVGDRTSRALDELRLENSALRERLAALEVRLGEFASTRTALAAEGQASASSRYDAEESASAALQSIAVDDDFVASVGRALGEIERKEEAERAQRRKELQAARIEERVTKLQTELGLNNRQTSDLRTALIGADDKREVLFSSLREGEGDPRDVRDSFRDLRDQTYTTLQGILTPEQFETFKKSDEDFGRRDFGGPGGPGPEAFGGAGARPQRDGAVRRPR